MAQSQDREGSISRPATNDNSPHIVDDVNDLGFVISDSIKPNVANLQCVELESFAKHSSLEQTETDETSFTLKDVCTCINVTKSPKPQNNLYNITDWTDATQTDIHHNRALQILTYMSTTCIRGAARDHSLSAAMEYDKQFHNFLNQIIE